MFLQPGSVLKGQYRIDALIGGGGMAMVYRAFDLNLQRVCAIKQNLDTSPQAQHQFHTEAILLANLSHTHLSRVTDHFIDTSGQQYLVMDFVEGENLESFVAHSGPLAEAQALAWIQGVLDAVAYCHNRRVIHRDIKPANLVKCQAEDKVVLVDFGIAKQQVTGGMTMPGAKAATPAYAPPEQYSGHTDERSDIYSLGATLYYMLTGQAPPDARLVAAGVETLVSPRTFNWHIRPATEQAVLRALATRVGDRPQSADELKGLLGLGPQPPAGTAGLGTANGPSGKGGLYLVVGMIALAVVLLAGFALVGLRSNGGTSSPPTATTLALVEMTSTSLATATLTPQPTAEPEVTPVTTEILTSTASLVPSDAISEPELSPTMAVIVTTTASLTSIAGTEPSDGTPPSTVRPGRRATSTPILGSPIPTRTPTATPTRRTASRPAPPIVPPPAPASVGLLPIPEPVAPDNGATMVDRVTLTWRSRNLLANEKFQVKLVRDRDNQDWTYEPTETFLYFVFDDSAAIFDQPGDFYWSVRMINMATNKVGEYSPMRRFMFQRQADEGQQDSPEPTPEPVPTPR